MVIKYRPMAEVLEVVSVDGFDVGELEKCEDKTIRAYHYLSNQDKFGFKSKKKATDWILEKDLVGVVGYDW